jgi:hypothetical protein
VAGGGDEATELRHGHRVSIEEEGTHLRGEHRPLVLGPVLGADVYLAAGDADHARRRLRRRHMRRGSNRRRRFRGRRGGGDSGLLIRARARRAGGEHEGEQEQSVQHRRDGATRLARNVHRASLRDRVPS